MDAVLWGSHKRFYVQADLAGSPKTTEPDGSAGGRKLLTTIRGTHKQHSYPDIVLVVGRDIQGRPAGGCHAATLLGALGRL